MEIVLMEHLEVGKLEKKTQLNNSLSIDSIERMCLPCMTTVDNKHYYKENEIIIRNRDE